MRKNESLTRRQLLKTTAGVAAGTAVVGEGIAQAVEVDSLESQVKKGRIKQSVCGWCYKSLSLDELAAASAKLGLVGIDLVKPEDFPTLKKYGLVSTMTPSHALPNGLCDPKFHEKCIRQVREAIEATAAEGWRNVICFSGNRRSIDDKTGMDHCVEALKQIIPLAEEKNVTVQMELLNSKVNHPDYMCDLSSWGIELVDRIGSDQFQTALRHLPHADHGRRCHPHHPEVSRSLWPLPHRRQPWPKRVRRFARTQLSRNRRSDRRHRFRRLPRPRVHPQTRPAHESGRSGRDL